MKYLMRVVFLLAMLCSLSFPCVAGSSDSSERYTIGVVPQFSIRQIASIWQPIIHEITKLSGVPIELKSSKNIPSFERSFEQGEYNFAYMNPYHAVVANRQQGYRPILRDHGKELFGVIVVRKDSAITDITQIDGKKIAFPAPNALGAALLPRAEFARKYNIKPEVSYVSSHDSVYLNTVMGITDAGGGVMATLNKQSLEVRDQLRILHTTTRVPKHPIVVHPHVPLEVVDKIVKAFEILGQSDKGMALLSQIPITKIGKTSLNDYKRLIEMGLDQFYVKKN